MNFLQAIENEMNRRDWTPYRLASAVSDYMNMSTVYRYLNGEVDITTEKLAHILKVLDLEIKSAPVRRRSKTRRER